MLRIVRRALVISLLTIVSCGGEEFAGVRPVSDAPEWVRNAKRAVVRISVATETGRSFGTGFFVKPGPYLVTNAHVVGWFECALPGCWVQIRLDYERGEAFEEERVFLEPVMVDDRDDIAFYLPRTSPNGPIFDPPLTVRLDDVVAPTIDERVHVIGHPFGRLKKWSEGEITSFDDYRVYVEGLIYPGNSGSFLLDGDGRLVGVVRASSDRAFEDEIRADFQAVRVGPILDLLAATSTAGPDTLRNIDRPIDREEVGILETVLFNNRRHSFQTPDGTEVMTVDAIGPICDAALAAPPPKTEEAGLELFKACVVPMRWFDCDTEDPHPAATCPDADVQAEWTGRTTTSASRLHEVSRSLGRRADIQVRRLEGRLADLPYWISIAPREPEATAPFTLAEAARHLAWKHQRVGTPDGWAIDAVRDYQDTPDYERAAGWAIDGLFILEAGGHISRDELRDGLKELFQDSSLTLAAHLEAESAIYLSGWSDLFD